MKELKTSQKEKYKVVRIVVQGMILALFLGLVIFLSIKLYPIFKAIQHDEKYREEFIYNHDMDSFHSNQTLSFIHFFNLTEKKIYVPYFLIISVISLYANF